MEQLDCCDLAVQMEGNLRGGAQTNRHVGNKKRSAGAAAVLHSGR